MWQSPPDMTILPHGESQFQHRNFGRHFERRVVLFFSHSPLLLQYQNSHKPYVSEWVWLYSNKTLFARNKQWARFRTCATFWWSLLKYQLRKCSEFFFPQVHRWKSYNSLWPLKYDWLNTCWMDALMLSLEQACYVKYDCHFVNE